MDTEGESGKVIVAGTDHNPRVSPPLQMQAQEVPTVESQHRAHLCMRVGQYFSIRDAAVGPPGIQCSFHLVSLSAKRLHNRKRKVLVCEEARH
jgi:hypothetical protein